MIDIQKTCPTHKLPIQRVGITNLILPIYIKDQVNGIQHSVANIDVFVDLSAEEKGTHMSRLAIGVQKFMDMQLNADLLKEIGKYIRQKCEAETAHIIYKFPYFIKKLAPVSKEPGIIHYNILFSTIINSNKADFVMSVESTTTSLCPCSKEISDNGAHNQRSKILIKCKPTKWVWIEDLIKIAESESSCQVYSVLKRPDEKYVTEYAYNNPHFVEDMVRDIYNKLSNLNDSENCFEWFEVTVRNEESIHQHDAFAKMSSK